MLVVMKNDATEAQVQAVIQEIKDMGYRGIPMPGALRTAVCIVGNKGSVEDSRLLALDGVKETIAVTKPYKLVSRETHPEATVVTINGIQMTEGFLLLAGMLLEIPIAMVLLSRVLQYRVNRWANIITGAAMIAFVIANGATDLDDIFFVSIVVVALSLIVWFAWQWPEPELRQ